MKKVLEKTRKGRMIHIRLDENTHRELKILAVRTNSSIQSMVEEMISRRVSEELELAKNTVGKKGRG